MTAYVDLFTDSQYEMDPGSLVLNNLHCAIEAFQNMQDPMVTKCCKPWWWNEEEGERED